MEEFIAHLKNYVDALEQADLCAQTCLSKLPNWDSISLLSTMAMIASEYGVNVRSWEISAASTLAELYALVCARRA